MFGFMKKIGKGIVAIGKVAVPVVATVITPEALINTAVAGVVKHIKPNSQGKNDSIPFLNLLISSGIAFAKNAPSMGLEAAIMPSIQEGVILMGSSTVIHQGTKLATKNSTLRINGKSL